VRKIEQGVGAKDEKQKGTEGNRAGSWRQGRKTKKIPNKMKKNGNTQKKKKELSEENSSRKLSEENSSKKLSEEKSSRKTDSEEIEQGIFSLFA